MPKIQALTCRSSRNEERCKIKQLFYRNFVQKNSSHFKFQRKTKGGEG